MRVRPFCSLGRLRTQKLIRLVDRFKYGLWKLYKTKLIHYGFASPEKLEKVCACMCACMCACSVLGVEQDIQVICERIWEKGPYYTKTKLKLRLEIPLRVNPVQKNVFICMITYLKSNRYRKSILTVPYPWETIKKHYRSDKLLESFSTITLKSLPMKKQYLKTYNFAFLLGKDMLNSLF